MIKIHQKFCITSLNKLYILFVKAMRKLIVSNFQNKIYRDTISNTVSYKNNKIDEDVKWN